MDPADQPQRFSRDDEGDFRRAVDRILALAEGDPAGLALQLEHAQDCPVSCSALTAAALVNACGSSRSPTITPPSPRARGLVAAAFAASPEVARLPRLAGVLAAAARTGEVIPLVTGTVVLGVHLRVAATASDGAVRHLAAATGLGTDLGDLLVAVHSAKNGTGLTATERQTCNTATYHLCYALRDLMDGGIALGVLDATVAEIAGHAQLYSTALLTLGSYIKTPGGFPEESEPWQELWDTQKAAKVVTAPDAPSAVRGRRRRAMAERAARMWAPAVCSGPGCDVVREKKLDAQGSPVALPGLKLCMGCKRLRYCSPACQKADWPRHKAVCGKDRVVVSDEVRAAFVPLCTMLWAERRQQESGARSDGT